MLRFWLFMDGAQTLAHHTIWPCDRGHGRGHTFTSLSSQSVTSLQQSLKTSPHSHTSLTPPPPVWEPLSHFSCSVQPPASLPSTSNFNKIIFITFPHSLPPPILLLLPLLAPIYQSLFTLQSNSCPLPSPITVDQGLFSVRCLIGDAD